MQESQDSAISPLRLALAVFVVVLLALLPLVFNPGYFSHDELHWAARAVSPGGHEVVWFPWTAIGVYQYRPLTFNLLLWFSRHAFEQPYLFHAICVTWGALNASLLAMLARGFGMRAWPAALGAIAFALGPYAMYVNGWVATLADLVWVSCALLIGLFTVGASRAAPAAIVAALLTAIAFLGKEAAVTIPPLLAVAWWFDGRKRTWLAATLSSGVVAALYLALRFDALLQPQGVQVYALNVMHIPLRWVEYQLFAQIPTIPEAFLTLARGIDGRVVAAALLWLGLLGALWKAGPRYALLFLIGGLLALVAVLPLGSSWNHYGYAFSAVTIMTVAAAWSKAPRWGRGVIALFALLNLAHGVAIMLMIHRVGTIQSVFSPALVDALGNSTSAAPLRLQLAPDAREWIFERLTHDVPSYRGVRIGGRVLLVGADAPADYRVEADGRLTRL